MRENIFDVWDNYKHIKLSKYNQEYATYEFILEYKMTHNIYETIWNIQIPKPVLNHQKCG